MTTTTTLSDQSGTGISDRTRWLALFVLCLGALMIVLDTTIVNVALPSIRQSLGFSETGLSWVINAYVLTFGGFLLLGGRLGDLYGHRRFFIAGIVVFTLASLVCGIANSQTVLIAARAIQGIGGAIANVIALSLVMNLFVTPEDRAKAMGVFGFVAAGGGSIGVFLGGLLTGSFSWHSVFLVNIPVGILVVILTLLIIPAPKDTESAHHHLDIWGAITITTSLLLAVYATINGNIVGWLAFQTIGLLLVALILMAIFVAIEMKVRSPLMPLGLFKIRNLTTASIVGVLWTAAMFAWFFLSTLYLQLILHYTPLQVGLSFLPGNLLMAVFSLGLSAKLVMKFGIKIPLVVGLSLASLGLLLFARAPEGGQFLIDVLPGMILLGLGAGIAFNPVLLAAMNDVPQDEAGLASGVLNTAFMMGGALGLAVLASVAASKTSHLLQSGVSQSTALLGGYHLAFLIGGIFGILAATLGAILLKISKPVSPEMMH